jgi:translation initiation factor IF-2
MSDKVKVVRLSKAAREFNIALDTVVDFLSDKGFDVIKSPNTKLDPEMYAILQNEFQDEKEVKKASRERNLEFLGQGPISIGGTKKQEIKEKIEETEIPDELFITNLGVGNKSEEPATEEKEEIVVEEIKAVEEVLEEKKPIEKVLKEEKPLEEILEEKTTPKETKATVIEKVTEEPIIEPPVVETVVEKESVEEVKETEIVAKDIPTPVKEVELPKEKEEVKTTVKIEKTPSPIIEEPVKETKVSEVKEEKAKIQTSQEEIPSAETPKSESKPIFEKPTKVSKKEKTEGSSHKRKEEVKITEKTDPEDSGELKVIGKIDLDGMNMRTRPKRKSKEEKKKEAEAKRKPGQGNKKPDTKSAPHKKEEKPIHKVAKEEEKVKETSTPKVDKVEAKTDDNFIPTRYTKLTGPKVLDKIVLPTIPKKKKPVASSSDDVGNRSKRKRKRIKPQTTGTSATANKGGNRSQPGAKGSDNHNKKPPIKRGKPTHRREPRPEPSVEDIQKKIKETLNRLSPSGKSKASKYRRHKRDVVSEHIREEQERVAEEKGTLKVTEFVTANELANMMNIGVTDIIKTCMQVGLFVSINQRLDAETIALVSNEYGFETEFVGIDDQDSLEVQIVEDDPKDLIDRAPIVTVMGHVDHGKTKLLDYIRKANVVAGEAGGITQHIGAYEVKTESGKAITFLDTPGHEAFTAMRARGAKVTDIAIIVIAADDSVMPQTREAINHAQAANVPIVFAFNKMDKHGVTSDKIKDQLSQMNILVEEWGGKYQSQEISAITGLGISDLLDKVLLEAEMLELKANPNKPGKGTVIEATLDKGRGYVTTVLVQDGEMKKGDIVIAGPVHGRVKAMFDERNKASKIAGPSVPVVILGLNGAPQAGDIFNVMADEKEAKTLASKRLQLIREQSLRTQKHITLDEIGRRIAIGDFKEMNIIIKGDVDGSIEALSDELLKLSTEEVQVNVIHKAVGAITESDVMLASASNAIIIGFQVRPVPQARKIAEKEQIDIRLYSIIYQATDEIKAAVKGMLAPKTEEKIICNIEVRDTFRITKVGTIAGCYVLDGKITRKTNIRLIRDGIVIYAGLLGSLKRFKDDVKEVSAGYECGLNIEKFNDIKVGDIVEGYEIVEVAR